MIDNDLFQALAKLIPVAGLLAWVVMRVLEVRRRARPVWIPRARVSRP